MRVTRKFYKRNGWSGLEQKIFEINVKPGCKEGSKIKFSGEGDLHYNREPGDVVFIIKYAPHIHFKHQGFDLLYTAKISLGDAFCGGSVIKIPTLDGSMVPFELSDIIKPNGTKYLYGKGLPFENISDVYGHLIITFDVDFPDYLSSVVKEVLEKYLP